MELRLCLAVFMLLTAVLAAEESAITRAANREFPSVFQAWNGATNKSEDPEKTLARHDLFFGMLGDRWEGNFEGLGTKLTPESIKYTLEKRIRLLKMNPNMIFIREIRYRDAHISYLPEDSAFWKREKSGEKAAGWDEGGYFLLAYEKPDFISVAAVQAKAAVESGIYDGIFLDWWQDDAERIKLLQAVREAIGQDKLILLNANNRKVPESAKYANGLFQEGFRSTWWTDWEAAADCMIWAEKNMRAPKINCFEAWYKDRKLKRNEVEVMRAVTAMALTFSDGYLLFADPNPLMTPDHLHDWYDFWDKSLGKAAGAPAAVKNSDGTYSREFEKGTVIYNPDKNKVAVIKFKEKRKSVADGVEGFEFQLKSPDGGIYLKKE